MKLNRFFIIVFCVSALSLMVGCDSAKAEPELSLKDLYGSDFLIGTAVNTRQVTGEDSLGHATIIKHFNSIVAENCMKSEKINPYQGVYNWTPADSFVDFGEANGMYIVGHCLVWHSQLAPWFPIDDKGDFVCADTLKQRLHDHIFSVVGRYKGRVHMWDVVNEAINDDGTYRRSPFYQILGEEFIPLAFQWAHEADPDAKLVINDFNMAKPGKRKAYVELVKSLKEKGLQVDAIGMQSHIGMDYPDFGEFEKSINDFAATGCDVMITEWDMSALPTIKETANISERAQYREELNPYPNGLSEEVSQEWNDRMTEFMTMLLRNKDKISRFNAWGVCDGDSWKNGWPIPGRVDYPLLFDRQYRMKPFLLTAIEN